MDQDDDVPAARAGASRDVDHAGAAGHEDEGNPVAELKSQILELGRRHDQLEGEDIRDFSHALSQLLNFALQQSNNAVSDPQLALRDQFIEGIRDATLRRELRKLVREKPQSTLFNVREWPVPGTLKELRSFLGFCSYYRRFIEGFSQIAGPLHDVVNLCLKETSHAKAVQRYKSIWTPQCQAAFEHLKDRLTRAPTLGYADFTLPFVIETDASNLGLGAVLHQQQNGKKVVVAYASRRLRGAEKNDRNYSSMKLELLALKWAVTEKFRSYLLGSKFTIITDNNPLCHLTTAKLGACEQRWVAQLAVFDFEVKYRPGRCNTAADALSRRPGLDEPDSASEDAEFDGSVAICNSLRTGTALGPDLLAAGVECSKVRQLQVTTAGEEDIECENTPTLPGIQSQNFVSSRSLIQH
ncbi:hypothetical protein F2P79_006618 [Pimephales promelas]|nr:hypothetical protein F2P79_006618 [Pimephales promelas]